MVAVLGEKLFELAVLTLAFAPLLPHELAGLVELPHADATSATTATTPIMARISLLQGDEDWIVSRPLSPSCRPLPVVLSHKSRLEKQVLRFARWRALRSE